MNALPGASQTYGPEIPNRRDGAAAPGRDPALRAMTGPGDHPLVRAGRG